jgi:hypothetical protein
MVPVNMAGGAAAANQDKAKPDAAAAAGADVQQTALNGAQVASLQEIVTAVATGQMPPDTARALIAAAFPLLSADQVGAMIGPLSGFTPAAAHATDVNPPRAQ